MNYFHFDVDFMQLLYSLLLTAYIFLCSRSLKSITIYSLSLRLYVYTLFCLDIKYLHIDLFLYHAVAGVPKIMTKTLDYTHIIEAKYTLIMFCLIHPCQANCL